MASTLTLTDATTKRRLVPLSEALAADPQLTSTCEQVKTAVTDKDEFLVDDGNTDEVTSNLWDIPTFSDPYQERKWAKEHMAGAFRVMAKFGYTDGSGGHISLRDPIRKDCFWISKSTTYLCTTAVGTLWT
jgi:hypothetical protein